MRHARFVAAVFAALAISAVVAPAWGAPPTDAQVDAFVTKVVDAGKEITDPREKARATSDAVTANMGEISWSEISIPQLEKLAIKTLISPSPELREVLHPRLLALSKLDSVDGARAADLALGAWPTLKEPTPDARKAEDEKRLEILLRGLKHPAAAENFKAGKGHGLLRALTSFSGPVIQENELVKTVEPYITPDLSPSAAANLGGILDFAMDPNNKFEKPMVDRIREKVGAAAKMAATKEDPRFKDDPKSAERTRKYLKDLNDLCNSAFARGELLDHAAPNIALSWSNSPTPITSSADFKGKVVIVDFWATWCGPCVASFPEMRKLAARYKDYPVVILGVTSEQGYHIARTNEKGSKPERIECGGDPKKEHELMSKFIKDMDMTWTVAFSDKSCFNPDFGVRGIPHIAIVTPDGKVRFNGLRPGNLAAEAERIDTLLKEFKLPHPSEPVASVSDNE